MAETITYSHNDIKRYLQHEMPPKEMHAFEKAMMDDPFLADAVDGFSQTNWPLANEHFAQIKKVIKSDSSAEKATSIGVWYKQWWKVAAMVIAIVGVAIVTYSVLKQPTEQQFSYKAPSANLQVPEKIAIDSIKPANGGIVNNSNQINSSITQTPLSVSGNNEAPLAKLDSKAKSQTFGTGQNVSSGTTTDNWTALSAAKPAAPSKADEVPIAMNNGVGYSTDKNLELTAPSAPHPNLRKDVAKADSTLSTINPKASSDYDLASEKKQESTNDSKMLDEVVVTGYGAKRQQKSVAASQAISSKETSKKASPSVGWSAYQQYISAKTDSTLKADGRSKTNTNIVVKFSLNKKGKPIKINTSSTDNYYQQRATAIIQEGPTWNGNGDTSEVTIIIGF